MESGDSRADRLGQLNAFLNRDFGQFRAICRQQNVLEHVLLLLAQELSS